MLSHAQKQYIRGMVQPLIDYGSVIGGRCGHSYSGWTFIRWWNNMHE